MKNRNNTDKRASGATADKSVARKMECADIQEVLFDYLTHELGESQSVLVREHIRRCPKCAAEAADIESTLDLLKRSDAPVDVRLSEERRERIIWAAFHPVMNWIDMHHRLVSLLLALLVLLAVFCSLRNFAIFRHIRLDDGITVKILRPPAEMPPQKKQ